MINKYLGNFLLAVSFLGATAVTKGQTAEAPMAAEVNFGLREYLGDQGSSLFFQRKPDYQGGGLNFGIQHLQMTG